MRRKPVNEGVEAESRAILTSGLSGEGDNADEGDRSGWGGNEPHAANSADTNTQAAAASLVINRKRRILGQTFE
jgi:hypothetical protein